MDPPSNILQPQQYSYPGQGQTPDNVPSTDSQPGPTQTFHGGQVVQQMNASLSQTSDQGIVDQTTQHVPDTHPVGYYPPWDQGNVQVPRHARTRYNQQPFHTGRMRYTDTGHAFTGQSHPQAHRETAGPSHHQQQSFQVQRAMDHAGLNQSAQHTMLGSQPFVSRVQFQQNFSQPAFRPSAGLNTGHGQSLPPLIWDQNLTVRPAIDTMEWILSQRHPDVDQHLTMMHNQQTQSLMQFQPQHPMFPRQIGSLRPLGHVRAGNIRSGPGFQLGQIRTRYSASLPQNVGPRHGIIQPSESGPNSSAQFSQEYLSSISPTTSRIYRHHQHPAEQGIVASRGAFSPGANQQDARPVTQGPPAKVAKNDGIKSQFNIGSVSTKDFVGHVGFQYIDSRRIEVPSSRANTPTQGQVNDFIKICNDFTESRTKDKITSMFSQLNVPERKVHPGFVISKYYTGDTAPEANAYIPDPLYIDHTKRVFKGKTIKIHQWLVDVDYAALVADAGAGKTTAARRFCQMVLKHEIPSLRHIQLVHFVTFAELDSSIMHTAYDLIFKQPLGTKLTNDSGHHGYEWVKCHADKILLVMDGLDQVGWSLEGINTSISYDQAAPAPVIIHNILHKDLFPCCKVIITSREHAVRHFPADVRPSKTISLTGLSLKDCEYLISNLAGKMGDIILNHLRTKSPGLLSLCRTPVFNVFSVVVLLENVEDAPKNLEDALKNLKDAPKTMSGILIRVLALFVNSEHQRGKDMEAVFSKLKQLAYVGTSEKRVLFEVAEIEALGLGITEVQDLIIITPCANIPYLFKIMEGLYRLFYCHQSIQEALTALYICAMPLPDFEKLVDENLDDPHFAVVRRILFGVMLDSSLRGNLNDLVIGNPCDEKAKKKILRDWLQKILVGRQKKVRKDGTNLPWNMIKCSDIELCSLLNECGDGVSDIIAEHMTSVDFTKRVLKADSLHSMAHVLSQSKHISIANFGKVQICDFDARLLADCLVPCHHVKIKIMQLADVGKQQIDELMNLASRFKEPCEKVLQVEVLNLMGVAQASDDVLGESLDLLSGAFQSMSFEKSSLRIQFKESCEGSKKISICDMRDGKYQVIKAEDLSTIQRVLKLFHQRFIAEITDRQPVEGDAACMRTSDLDYHQLVTGEFHAVKLLEPVLNPLINLFNKCKSVKIQNLQLSDITEPLLHGLMNISNSFLPHERELEVAVLNLPGVAQTPDDVLRGVLDLLSNTFQSIRFEESSLQIRFEGSCEEGKKISIREITGDRDMAQVITVKELAPIQRSLKLSDQKFVAEMSVRKTLRGDAACMYMSMLGCCLQVIEFGTVQLSGPELNQWINVFKKYKSVKVEVLNLLGVAQTPDDVLGKALDLLSDACQSIRFEKSSLWIRFEGSCEEGEKISIREVRDDTEYLYPIQADMELSSQEICYDVNPHQLDTGYLHPIQRALKLSNQRFIAGMRVKTPLKPDAASLCRSMIDSCQEVNARFGSIKLPQPELDPWISVMKKCKSVKFGILNLSEEHYEPEDCLRIAEIAEAARVEVLRMRDCKLTTEHISKLKEGMEGYTGQLTGLNLQRNDPGLKGCRYIGEIVKTARVEVLNLSWCGLTTDHISELKKGLNGYEGQLTVLDLSWNEVVCTKLHGEIFEKYRVEELHIEGGESCAPTAQDVMDFISALDSMRDKVCINFTNKQNQTEIGSAERLRRNIRIKSN